MKLKLTQKTVDNLKPTAKRQYFYDTLLPGYGLHVGVSGVKTYFFEYRMGGRGSKQRRFNLGRAYFLDQKEARRRAKILRLKVADGIDVFALKKKGINV